MAIFWYQICLWNGLVFVWLHHGGRVALSAVGVLWNYLCPTADLAVGARPVPSCQGRLSALSTHKHISAH